MTLTQLEYIVALDTYRHFVLASEKCFVTQPTLSMQVQKLEDELGVKIFDRTKQPVIPTGSSGRSSLSSLWHHVIAFGTPR
jgi:LysR family hydrogen peroxide-inducible transcriptional activator